MKQEQHFCHHCRHIHLQTFVPTDEAGVYIVRCAGCGNRAVWQFESHNGILGDEYVVLETGDKVDGRLAR